MAITRSQTGELGIKKEEQEDYKPTLLLNGVTTTTRNKITKRKPSKNRSKNLVAPEIKVEEDTDIKSLLQTAPKSSKLPKGPSVSQEQINQLIDYVVNDKLSVYKAAPKANIPYTTAYYYYDKYKNDPDKRVPSPTNRYRCATIYSTQEQIKNVIKYVNEDKMPLREASAKAKMSYKSVRYYYGKYLNDPDHSIPIPLNQHYTQDQKNEFIGYVVNDKMSIKAASKKANMSAQAGRKYYHEYFSDQHPDIPTPSHIPTHKRYTQEQIKEVISYIVDDKMTVYAASRKVNMCKVSAINYYHLYLKDNNMEIPVSKYSKRYTQDKINELIGYIVDDKMSRNAASKKANMTYKTATRHFRQYLKDNNTESPVPKHARCYTQHQINEFICYIVDGKMNIMDASKKANIHYASAAIYYRKYRKEHNLDPPALKYRQDKIKEIAGYVIDDKMSVRAAAKKANVSASTGQNYYRKYLMDKKRDASN